MKFCNDVIDIRASALCLQCTEQTCTWEIEDMPMPSIGPQSHRGCALHRMYLELRCCEISNTKWGIWHVTNYKRCEHVDQWGRGTGPRKPHTSVLNFQKLFRLKQILLWYYFVIHKITSWYTIWYVPSRIGSSGGPGWSIWVWIFSKSKFLATLRYIFGRPVCFSVLK